MLGELIVTVARGFEKASRLKLRLPHLPYEGEREGVQCFAQGLRLLSSSAARLICGCLHWEQTALPGCGGRARERGWALGAFPDLTSSLFSTSVSQQVTAIVTAIELEGAFKGHLVQQPRNKEGHRSSSRLSRAWSSLAL